MSNGKAYNTRMAGRLAAVMVLRQQALLRMCENEQYLQVLYAFAFLTTKSEIRVPPTTPLVGAEKGTTHLQVHSSESQHLHLQVLFLFMGCHSASMPLNTRSHASRGNAEGGRFASDGEGHNLQVDEINQIKAGGCGATEGEKKNPEIEVNPEKEINPCTKERALCMPPIKGEWQNTTATPAGIVADYAYDAAGKLLSVDNNINGTATARRDYHYDAAGNRDEISINGRTPSVYEYTRLNRLKNADHPAVEESWFHDEYYVDDWEGNLIASHNNVSQKGFNALHQLVLDETYAYTYDLDGNLKTRALRSDPAQVTNYHFNAANQLVKVVAADGSSVEFGYDVAGRRARKTNRGAGGQLLNDRYYSYNGADLETEYYGNGAKHLNYLYGPGIDNVLAVTVAGISHYFLKDAQNSVLAITNYQKTVLKRYWYDSYGNIVAESGALPFENTVTYTGREWDSEIGMYYLRARYYDPRPARFISEDPIWQTNLYMYVNDNPLMYVDPWGLDDSSGSNNQNNSFWNSDLFYTPYIDRTSEGLYADMVQSLVQTQNPDNSKLVVGINYVNAGAGAAEKALVDIFPRNPKEVGIVVGAGVMLKNAGRFLKGVSGKLKGASCYIDDMLKGGAGEADEIASAANRLPQDTNVNPIPPEPKPTSRPISKSPTQNKAAQELIEELKAQGYRDIRVNQQQVNAEGIRCGICRPDVQATHPETYQRFYWEFDTSSSYRGLMHELRLLSNDPGGYVNRWKVD